MADWPLHRINDLAPVVASAFSENRDPLFGPMR